MSIDRVFYYFDKISKIDRISYNEKEIAEYLLSFGRNLGLATFSDSENNLVIKKKAHKGNKPAVILQAHSDMVWETVHKDNGEKRIPHNIFVKDGIMRADGTTLGADNGIGIAMILAILEHNNKNHPTIEAVFTANEEETMGGAIGIKSEYLSGQYLINLDSEKEGVFTIGSAGGISSFINFPLERIESSKPKTVEIVVEGCKGGHSGLEIGQKHENPILLLVRLLQMLDIDYELVSLEGGTRSSSIPQQAYAKINVEDVEELQISIEKFKKNRNNEWQYEEDSLRIRMAEICQDTVVYNKRSQNLALLLLESLPHGVYSRTAEFVFSSVNLAIVKEKQEELTIELSLRSSYEWWYHDKVKQISRLTSYLGGVTTIKDEYSAWEYKKEGKLIELFSESYSKLFNRNPIYENIHAGVECGILIKNCSSIKEAISIGPTICNPHTTLEYLDVQSVNKVYCLLNDVLEKLA